MGGKFLKSWSKTIEILALSSGETELGALVKLAPKELVFNLCWPTLRFQFNLNFFPIQLQRSEWFGGLA